MRRCIGTATALVSFVVFMMPCPVRAQDRNVRMHIVYPAAAFTDRGPLSANTGGFIIDLTKPPYNARGDSVTDNTAAFKTVLNDIRNILVNKANVSPYCIYLPSGIYLVSDRLMCDSSPSIGFSNFRLIGEDRNNTVVKLKDNCAGFGAGTQKEVIACYKREDSHIGGQMWGNEIRNITVNTGRRNPGAIGVVFLGANACSIDNLTIRSEDGQGWCGLFLPDWSQQGHFSDMTVEGFDQGIVTLAVAETNPIFEHVTLTKQNVVGLSVNRSAPCIRKLQSINTVEAVKVDGDGAHCVILDSYLSGGSNATAAIRLVKSSTQQLFARNVTVSGYRASIHMDSADVVTGNVKEWLSGKVFRIDTTITALTLNLPVEDAPLVPWESDTAQWANPDAYSGASDFDKIQAALNSGKSAVYFRRYFYTPQTSILTVPATVKQIDFMNSASWIWGGFSVNQTSTTPLFIEHMTRKPLFSIAAKRTLVARYGSLTYQVATSEPVVAHLQNIAVLSGAYGDNFCPPNATIYARCINEEQQTTTNFVVNGGKLWVLGFKTESDQTAFDVKNNGSLEVLGGYVNFAGQSSSQNPDVLNENSNVSYIGTNYMARTHWDGIWEIRDGVTHKFVNQNFPVRITGSANNYFVPLYVGTGTSPTYAVNYALNKPVKVSSDSTQGPSAVDGNGYTTWTGAHLPDTLTVDLQTVITVDSIRMSVPPQWATRRSQTVLILGSLDGVVYSTIKTAAAYAFGATGNYASVQIAYVKVRYVRVIVSANVVDNNAVIAELEVYGTRDGVAVLGATGGGQPSFMPAVLRIRGLGAFSIPNHLSDATVLHVEMFNALGKRVATGALRPDRGGCITMTPSIASVARGAYILKFSTHGRTLGDCAIVTHE